ncbi:MAG TPA: hypothetical protein VN457_00530, partial [Chlamydiales bacterium]|nr:hypothetical protein [Chlamydiales bacterium]
QDLELWMNNDTPVVLVTPDNRGPRVHMNVSVDALPREFSQLSHLNTLKLFGSKINNFANVPQSVTDLELTDNETVDDEGIQSLKHLKNLKTLVLKHNCTQVQGRTLHELPESLECICCFYPFAKTAEGQAVVAALRQARPQLIIHGGESH